MYTEKNIINPFSFVKISDFYYGKLDRFKTDKCITKEDKDKIKKYSIIFVEAFSFVDFVENFFPLINQKIILITGGLALPQVELGKHSDKILRSDKVILWFSQNPIYENNEKYFAIPYGINITNTKAVKIFCKKANEVYKTKKTINILNSPVKIHQHLPENHVRKKYDILGRKAPRYMHFEFFFEKLLKSKFVVSTTGDREDCHRHYECIGLGAIPISNVSSFYKNIFGDNMEYKTPKEIIELLNKNTLQYREPNQNFILEEYHFENARKIINLKINKLI